MSYCPKCYSEEIPASSPRTMFTCGSSTYDDRPGTFRQSDNCKSLEKQKGENSAIDRRFRSMESRIKKLEKQQATKQGTWSRGPTATYMEINGVPVSVIQDKLKSLKNLDLCLIEQEEVEPDEQDIKVKRKPMPDGTLLLTESELREFNKLFYHNTKCLKISASGVFILSNAEKNIINNYKAILYLAERFELIKED